MSQGTSQGYPFTFKTYFPELSFYMSLMSHINLTGDVPMSQISISTSIDKLSFMC
jgi:hypothetical protein